MLTKYKSIHLYKHHNFIWWCIYWWLLLNNSDSNNIGFIQNMWYKLHYNNSSKPYRITFSLPTATNKSSNFNLMWRKPPVLSMYNSQPFIHAWYLYIQIKSILHTILHYTVLAGFKLDAENYSWILYSKYSVNGIYIPMSTLSSILKCQFPSKILQNISK